MKQIILLSKVGDMFIPQQNIYDRDTEIDVRFSNCSENDAEMVLVGEQDNGFLVQVHNKVNETVVDVVIPYSYNYDKEEVEFLLIENQSLKKRIEVLEKIVDDITANLES